MVAVLSLDAMVYEPVVVIHVQLLLAMVRFEQTMKEMLVVLVLVLAVAEEQQRV